MIGGINIVVVPDLPRYQLPAEVMPGVQWPLGFRDRINAWARDFLGNLPHILPDGRTAMLRDGHRSSLHMNPRTYEMVKAQMDRMQAEGFL